MIEVLVTIICIVAASITCYYLGLGYLIDKHTRS
jgi:hypothetical protein